MDEKKFEEMMDRWAAREMDAAPEIRPVPEVYGKLRDRRKPKPSKAVPWPVRWAAVGVAGAAVVLFLVIRPADESGPLIGLREGKSLETRDRVAALQETEPSREEAPKPAVAGTAPAERMAKADKDEKSFAAAEKKSDLLRAVFQYRPAGAAASEELDIMDILAEPITLSPKDDYRISFELARERYVYIFQAGPGGTFARLFPNAEYSPEGNPVRPGRVVAVPSLPGWLFVTRGEGEATVYLAMSAAPRPDWDDVISRHDGASRAGERKNIAETMAGELLRFEQDPAGDVSVRVFRFRVR